MINEKSKRIVEKSKYKELKVEDWYNLIAYVPQDGDLIDMTIKENVLFGAQGKATCPYWAG